MFDLAKERLEICNKCKYYRSDKLCRVCGCFMPLKATFKIFNCPLNKWMPVQNEVEEVKS